MISLIPLPYKILGGVVILTIVVGGSFAYGYNKAEDKYLVKIATYKTEAELLQTKLDAALANVQIKVVTEYVDRIQKIKEKEYVYRDKIITVPSKCELSNGWVYLHDASASGRDAESARVSDEASSGIKDTQALDTITGNYSICQQNIKQLNALQEWALKAKAEVDRQNKEARE